MSLGVEIVLPSDCLNINEFRAIHMHTKCTHSDAHVCSLEQELLPKFHNFGGEYLFAIEFACLVCLFCIRWHLISILTVCGIDHITRKHDARGAKWLSFFSIRQGIEGVLA